jgi:4-hydroxy-3-methylbut-2-enyl diphosphate reductase
VYTYGPLIHNSIVIQELKQKGIDVYKEGDSIERPCCLVIRAHGIPPAVKQKLEQSGFDLINATCPHVMRAQNEVKKYSREGYSIVIAGDKNHAEVVGLVGFAHNNTHVVSTIEEISTLDIKEPILLIAQTTFNAELFGKMKTELGKRVKNFVIVDTICLATAQRQNELLEIAQESDAIVVVGDKTSANTMRLVTIAKDTGKHVYFIQVADQLDFEFMKKYKAIGITAGASTPDSVSSEVAKRLEQL